MPNNPLLDYAIIKAARIRLLLGAELAAGTFRFVYDVGGALTGYDLILPGSRVTRNASLATGEATLALDNSDGTWNSLYASETALGGGVDGDLFHTVGMHIGDDVIPLFTGKVMGVEYDEKVVTLKLQDKLNGFLKTRIGDGRQGIQSYTVPRRPGYLVWKFLTESAELGKGAGLDDTEDVSNVDIDYSAWLAWDEMMTGLDFSMKAQLTGQTVQWCLERICEMTGSYIWQRGDGKITFAPPMKNGQVYGIHNTSPGGIKLTLATHTLTNNVNVYYGYNTETGKWSTYTTSAPPASQTTFGIISETDDNNIIWNVNLVSALAQATEITSTYRAPFRMFSVDALLPAYEEELTSIINVTQADYGIAGEGMIVEAITFDLDKSKVHMLARWEW